MTVQFLPTPPINRLRLRQAPVSMAWGPERLAKLHEEELGESIAPGDGVLFFNAKRDQLHFVFRSQTAWENLRKLVPRGGFVLPAPVDGELYVDLNLSMLKLLLRMG